MRRSTRAAAIVTAPAVRAVRAFSTTRPLTLLGWHRVGAGTDGLTTRPEDFEAHLDVLQEWGAQVLPLTEAYQRLRAQTLPEKAVALTFDDGYASVIEQAWPRLRRRGLPATLFVVSGLLSGASSFPWDHAVDDADLARLASAEQVVHAAEQGLSIGSHTVTHRWLPGLSAAEVDQELVRSRSDLEDLLGRSVTTFAYPMGGLTPGIRDQVHRAGYELAVTCERGVNRADRDPLMLRRAFAFDRCSDVRRQLDGGHTWARPLEARRLAAPPQW